MSHSILNKLFAKLDTILVGNGDGTRLAVTCLLARGHLLIEDVPGTGKTTLAHALASLCDIPFKRIQFTADLLPADITGVTIFDLETNKFRFKRGPIFTSTLLADEINRATPKTQSALLQAMEEQQVSVEGNSIDLPDPFFVIATQNPLEQSGTFPLPESQLDRFLIRLSLGYPSDEQEQVLLSANTPKPRLNSIISELELQELFNQVNQVHVSRPVINYLQTLLKKTRICGMFVNGLSPRAGLQWLQAARAWTVINGRDAVLPDDIKYLAKYTACHRLKSVAGSSSQTSLEQIIAETPVI